MKYKVTNIIYSAEAEGNLLSEMFVIVTDIEDAKREISDTIFDEIGQTAISFDYEIAEDK